MAALRVLTALAAFAAHAGASSASCGAGQGEESPPGRCASEAPPDARRDLSSDHLLLQVGKRGALEVKKELICKDMSDVERTCSPDGCTVLADNMRGKSCKTYCEAQRLTCVGAWEEVDETCGVQQTLTCEESGIPTSDLLCQCAPPGAAPVAPVAPSVPPPAAPSGDSVLLSAFFWNVHWECSVAARGASRSCKDTIGRRFAQLAQESKAEIVASIELSDGMSKPASFEKFGLAGWTQVDGPCARGSGGDSAALAFAPNWEVEKSGGGCLRHDYDTRAFAVARVKPPAPVPGCPSLCVVAIHAPHSSITKGKETVMSVCGEARERCAVAMGDWNTPASGVGGLWADLIGGAAPSWAKPDERTCCWPESSHYGIFDHIATNIEGAHHDSQTVHPYQHLEENPVKQHRAVSASILLPGGAAALTQLKG